MQSQHPYVCELHSCNTNQFYLLWTTCNLIFVAFYILFPAVSLIFTDMILFHQVMSERSILKLHNVGVGSGIIWPSIFMIPALFTLMIHDSLAILFRYSWFICHCFIQKTGKKKSNEIVHVTFCFNVSNPFSNLLKIISLNKSPKLKSQEKWNKWYDRPTPGLPLWIVVAMHFSLELNFRSNKRIF